MSRVNLRHQQAEQQSKPFRALERQDDLSDCFDFTKPPRPCATISTTMTTADFIMMPPSNVPPDEIESPRRAIGIVLRRAAPIGACLVVRKSELRDLTGRYRD
jgi:hypothetical protein